MIKVSKNIVLKVIIFNEYISVIKMKYTNIFNFVTHGKIHHTIINVCINIGLSNGFLISDCIYLNKPQALN